ncbi:MAG: MscL family protein [Acidimicrobiales bacterium]
MKGFKNFLMQGELIVIAVGLVVALSFSTLIKAFTDNIITPLINSLAGGGSSGNGLGWTVNGQRINVGAFISAIVYFVVFMAVVYFIIVVPYRSYMQRRGTTVFGPPAATKECPRCLSGGLPLAATKCKFCSSDVPVSA